nr:YhgE/Pip family protein [uncultured Mediterraneibacter sp.]
MRNAFRIFRRDMKRLLRNPAAILVLIGVSILPSLYAWFNIAANIDPYANTSGIKVAVANLDTDATHDDLTINAGSQIIDQLKENDQLGWTFVSKDAAIEGVKSGEYYAAIIIPQDFSESLLSVLSGKIETPELEYYTNEKLNAIAPKITSSGASTIQTQVNNTFSSVASETIAGILKDSVFNISDSVDSTNAEINDLLTKANNNIKEYEQLLEKFSEDSSDTSKLIENAKDASTSLGDAATSGANALSSADSVMKTTRSSAGDFSSALSKSLSDGELLLGQASSSASAGLTELATTAGKINTSVSDALGYANSVNELNADILKKMQDLANKFPGTIGDQINAQISTLQTQNQSNQELINSLQTGNNGIKDAIDTTTATQEQLTSLTKESINNLHTFRSTFDQNILPLLGQTLDTFSTLTGQVEGMLNGIPATSKQMNDMLDQLESGLSNTTALLDSTKESLSAVSDKLSTIQTDLNALTGSAAYQKLLSLEGIDAESISSFMSSPVEINTETYYAVDNYGSSMTPFYSNLAIWVGGIVLIAIFKMEVDKDESMRGYGQTTLYFGRWLLYMAVGLVQGFIVCLGDTLLPGVQCNHPAQFILTGMVCSFVYVNIIYALSLTFKHIGKALCVILVILQIPGSSGTYPIEMTPAFFQKLHPLLPFTYGVNAMREAIAGFYGTNFRNDLLILLLCYVPISLIIGLGLRPALSGLNHLFDKKLAETEFMMCEPHEAELSRSTQLSMLLQASLSIEDLRLVTAEKAQRFENNYKKMIRIGFLAIAIIPLVFLILMFSLESKIVFLTLWIISIIAIAVWLIIVEYIHTKLEEQKELAGMSYEEMLENFRGKEAE